MKLFPTAVSELESVNPEIITSGTGFAINQSGYIITNDHVIENADSIFVKGINNNFAESYPAQVVIRDKNNDLAIIKIIDINITIYNEIPYNFKRNLSDVGESVFALGYPLRATMGDEIKLTTGVISAKTGFQGDISSYQISVPVQPGNSGGPLIDNDGNVVAVISAKHIGAENASYAVKMSYLFNMLELIDDEIELNSTKILNNMELPQQVKIIKNFVYIIECK